MPRYILHVEYDGTRYAGWQIQPEDPTVQGAIVQALGVILRTPVSITGSGRTDAGVHAGGQVAHFDLPDNVKIDPEQLKRNLFGLLPRDIAVFHIEQVSDDFHARFDAVEREYHYFFTNRPMPLRSHYTAYWWHELDIDRMNLAAEALVGDTDCTSFTPMDPEQPHLRCLITKAVVETGDDRNPHRFIICANRFLRSVVRSVMGTLIEVGRGKINPDEFKALITHPDRTNAGPTAPAKGLVLHRVKY